MKFAAVYFSVWISRGNLTGFFFVKSKICLNGLNIWTSLCHLTTFLGKNPVSKITTSCTKLPLQLHNPRLQKPFQPQIRVGRHTAISCIHVVLSLFMHFLSLSRESICMPMHLVICRTALLCVLVPLIPFVFQIQTTINFLPLLIFRLARLSDKKRSLLIDKP